MTACVTQESYALLAEAVQVIRGLADQQAMPDDWFEEPLARFEAALLEWDA